MPGRGTTGLRASGSLLRRLAPSAMTATRYHITSAAAWTLEALSQRILRCPIRVTAWLSYGPDKAVHLLDVRAERRERRISNV